MQTNRWRQLKQHGRKTRLRRLEEGGEIQDDRNRDWGTAMWYLWRYCGPRLFHSYTKCEVITTRSSGYPSCLRDCRPTFYNGVGIWGTVEPHQESIEPYKWPKRSYCRTVCSNPWVVELLSMEISPWTTKKNRCNIVKCYSCIRGPM